jgi:hypothetical protein
VADTTKTKQEIFYTIRSTEVLTWCRLEAIQASEKRDAIQQYRYSHTNDRGIG